MAGRADEAMTRSEERMNVGTTTEQTGRARLRKYVITENVQQSVPVSRGRGPGRARAGHRSEPGRGHVRAGDI
jgi:stress response protein YsnF